MYKTIKLLPLLVAASLLSSCTASRIFFKNLPALKDQRFFPSTPVAHAPERWDFPVNDMSDSISQKLWMPKDRFSIESTTLDDHLERSPVLGFMIFRSDTLIYERFFDKKHRETDFTSFSMAKSFVGMLVGIAIDEKLIKSANDPICDYFPEIDRNLFGKVTIQHLLNQTSGIEFVSSGKIYYTKRLDRDVMKMKVRFEPGTKFRYENGNTQLLGMLLTRVSGMPVEEYLSKKIWSKIGTEQDLYWSTDRKKEKGGQPKAFCCLNGKARDFAKFGRLMENGGNWNGEQVIPKWWIEQTLSRERHSDHSHCYKNQIWSDNTPSGTYYCAGLYGQYIWIYPPKKIMIVKFSDTNFARDHYWQDIFGKIVDQL